MTNRFLPTAAPSPACPTPHCPPPVLTQPPRQIRACGKVVPITRRPDPLPAAADGIATVADLMQALHRALSQGEGSAVFYMSGEERTVSRMIEQVCRRTHEASAPLRLSQLLREARSERALLCLRLALLELVRSRAVLLRAEPYHVDILLVRPTAQ
jgi:segregation and condensation protein A